MEESNELMATTIDDTFDVKLFSKGGNIKQLKLSFVNSDYAEPLYINFDHDTVSWRIRKRNWRTDNIESVAWVDGRVR